VIKKCVETAMKSTVQGTGTQKPGLKPSRDYRTYVLSLKN
jgi:hypothetical protein